MNLLIAGGESLLRQPVSDFRRLSERADDGRLLGLAHRRVREWADAPMLEPLPIRLDFSVGRVKADRVRSHFSS